jgi:hypothetical protein
MYIVFDSPLDLSCEREAKAPRAPHRRGRNAARQGKRLRDLPVMFRRKSRRNGQPFAQENDAQAIALTEMIRRSYRDVQCGKQHTAAPCGDT